MGRIKEWLFQRLVHRRLRGVDIHDPQVTLLRREIIQGNPFLRRIYQEWYAAVASKLPGGPGAVLELGSGAGFLSEFVPDLVTSETFFYPHVRVVLDGQRLPFSDGALRGLVLIDVLHHLPQVGLFFREAARCVRPGGALTMIEPWVTAWSRFVYGRLHHEPFVPDATDWEFPEIGPLAQANVALPWIVFARDRARFEREFPQWTVDSIELKMPFRYLLSGGVSCRPLAPGWSYGAWQGLERSLGPWMKHLAILAHITLRRTAAPSGMA
ncbi:MAG: methyltransferase domain-containing protein [Verrucomicrobia bacterium]|nr:methyltransferase domain-containing protein [Verrucomicrobiota bacterium]